MFSVPFFLINLSLSLSLSLSLTWSNFTQNARKFHTKYSKYSKYSKNSKTSTQNTLDIQALDAWVTNQKAVHIKLKQIKYDPRRANDLDLNPWQPGVMEVVRYDVERNLAEARRAKRTFSADEVAQDDEFQRGVSEVRGGRRCGQRGLGREEQAFEKAPHHWDRSCYCCR